MEPLIWNRRNVSFLYIFVSGKNFLLSLPLTASPRFIVSLFVCFLVYHSQHLYNQNLRIHRWLWKYFDIKNRKYFCFWKECPSFSASDSFLSFHSLCVGLHCCKIKRYSANSFGIIAILLGFIVLYISKVL